jgi:hypothetical protein
VKGSNGVPPSALKTSLPPLPLPTSPQYWHNFLPCIAFEFLDVGEQETGVSTPHPLLFLSCIVSLVNQSTIGPIVEVPA